MYQEWLDKVEEIYETFSYSMYLYLTVVKAWSEWNTQTVYVSLGAVV